MYKVHHSLGEEMPTSVLMANGSCALRMARNLTECPAYARSDLAEINLFVQQPFVSITLVLCSGYLIS
jgi:hypothetical protein